MKTFIVHTTSGNFLTTALLEKIGNMDTKAEGFDMFQVLK